MLGKILDSDLVGKGVIGLPDIPGLPVEEMQRKFEETAREVIIPKFNALVDELSAEDAAGNVGATGENGETTTVQAELGVLHEKAEKAKQTGTAAAENANEAKTTAAEAVEAVSEVREYVETINGKVEAAVSTNSQSLSAEKQKQARANIGAIGAAEIGEMGGTVSYAAQQNLSEGQQTQARENIGAAATADLGGCWIEFTDEDGNPTDEPYLHWEEGGDGKKPDTVFSELLVALGNAVSVEPQGFTEAQKAQARANIGAAAVGEGGGAAGNAVLYDKQTLTDAQKQQARDNIGAAAVGNAVSVEAQGFTEAQKAQARANIGAAAVGEGGGAAGNAVLYDEQTLTDAQKAQARANIGAVAADEVEVDGFVSFGGAQSLTDEQKAQARANIGAAAAGEGGGGGTSAEGAVSYASAQSLSDAQKQQARDNIGAANATHVTNMAGDIEHLQDGLDELEVWLLQTISKVGFRLVQLERAAGLQPPVSDTFDTNIGMEDSYDELFGQT